MADTLDPEKTENLLYNVYSYRGVDDLSVFKDENNVGLTTTYPERFLELTAFHTQNGNTLKARQILLDTINRFPIYYQSYVNLFNHYKSANLPDSAEIIFKLGISKITEATEVWPGIALYYQFLGELNFMKMEYPDAINAYKKAFKIDPSSRITAYRLIHMYATTNQRDSGLNMLNYWLSEHPDDMFARNMYNTYWRTGR